MNEVIEKAAKAAYAMMIARTVSSIAEELEHCWDNQSERCQSDWRAAIEAGFAAAGVLFMSRVSDPTNWDLESKPIEPASGDTSGSAPQP